MPRSLIRINKFIADSINISRRGADRYVKEGRVKVNGSIVKEFINIDKVNDTVELDGEIIKPVKKRHYFAFYKPPFVLSAVKDESNKSVVCDYFKDVADKLICVGRLDYLSEGLLLITNDGEFANLIMHPKFKLKKTYLVKTKRPLSADMINTLSEGVRLDDGFFKPLKLEKTANPSWVLISINTGRNRILRRFFQYFNIPISKLKRISIGDIQLGDLKEGQYRKLKSEELIKIKKNSYLHKNY